MRWRLVAALSLPFTYLFFLDYLPPVSRVHIPYDLEGFHFPLANYAFQALREGRFPEWDASQYAGLSFAGNPQTGLFYPPLWLLFALNSGRSMLSYAGLEALVFAHVWLAFLLCYLWLRHKRLAELPSILGAGALAYSGYLLFQLQHFGQVAGYAWMPLGLWGIDDSAERGQWRPLWKLTAASALCFLSGYPPTWAVFAACMFAYSAWRWRLACRTVAALAVSLLFCMVQILPTLEVIGAKPPEARYGGGPPDPEFYAAYLAPNYFDFGMDVDPWKNPTGLYLYLGAPALFGLLCLARGKWRDPTPLWAVGALCALIAENPFGLVWQALRHSSVLSQVVRDYSFLAGVSFALAALAAFGLDGFLARSARPRPVWLASLAGLGMLAWMICLWRLGRPRGAGFPPGWGSALAAAITLCLFAAALYLLRTQRGPMRALLAALLLCMVGLDYHVFGAARRFNASKGLGLGAFRSEALEGMDDRVYRQLRAHPEYRVAVDETGPQPYELVLHGMRTPHGADPFYTASYRKLMETYGRLRSDREVEIDTEKHEALRVLGVRYVVTSRNGPRIERLRRDPGYRLLEPSNTYYQVFELIDARPSYGWVEGGPGAAVSLRHWTPEIRRFAVRSAAGGRFGLSEQLLPGWHATVDGVPVRIDAWLEAFQSVRVPPGEHTLEFRFHSRGLRAGALISLASLLVAGWTVGRQRT